MTPSIFDRLADDFPHGTIEGSRTGCTGVDCPTEPYTCMDIARLYRTDFRFQKLYKQGLRGTGLREAYTGPASPAPATPSDSEAAGQAPEIEPLPAVTDRWDSLTGAERDRVVILWKEHGLTATEIGEKIGLSPIGAGRFIAAARRRQEASAESETVSSPVEDHAFVESLPVAAVAVVARFGAPPVSLSDVSGPQLAKMWVVLDRENNIVLATPNPNIAIDALADEWRSLLDAESGS